MKQFFIQLLAVCALLANTQSIFAQAPDTLWTKTFGTSDGELGNAVQQTSDGGFIITGQFGTVSGAVDSGDVWLIRTDAAGNTLWTKTYGGSKRDEGASVQQTADDGYIIAGSTFSYGAGESDIWLIRTDASGDTLWTKTYGGTSTETPSAIQQTSDGGFIITGNTRSYGEGSTDAWLIRTNADGDTLWTKVFGGSAQDSGASGQQTADGGFVFTGNTFSFGAPGQPDLWLIRTDADGDSLWTKIYNGPYFPWSFDVGRSVQQTSDGGFVIVGEADGASGSTNSEVWVIRTDAGGDTLWTRILGGASTDRGNDVQQTSDGGFIIATSTLSFKTNSLDGVVVRLDAAGDSLWSIMLGDTGSDQATSVRQTSDSGFIIIGFTSSFGAGGNDVWLIRLASDTPTSVEDFPPLAPTDFQLRQNYPNPFNPSTSISYSLEQSGLIELKIYDALGRLVRTLVQGELSAGTHSVLWDGRDERGLRVASGNYFYQLSSGDFRSTRGMLLIK